ncbi:hypothetical protein [Stenotrophomonas maltophilia]|uniref:hypothetical protein n=1 Tax=Stenotrophomonas maltophilia TaxID=40324 RepID=UPI001FA80AFF|nr:hypothetical protein [Stenotrophomonas maltophilia]
MPSVSAIECFAGYQFRAISPKLERRLRGKNSSLTDADLRKFECYLQITRQRYNEGDSKSLQVAAAHGFIYALFHEDFFPIKTPWAVAARAVQTFGNLHPNVLWPKYPCTDCKDRWPSSFSEEVAAFGASPFDIERLAFWQGWSCTNKQRQKVHLRLHEFSEQFGNSRALELLGAAATWLRGRRATRAPLIQDFAAYAVFNHPETDFGSPQQVSILIHGFFESFFRGAASKMHDLNSAVSRWKCFRSILVDHLLGLKWATPSRAVPYPRTSRQSAERSKVITLEDGSEVKNSLLTAVPLDLSSGQASELIFKTIKQDVRLVEKWATEEVRQSWDRAERRKVLAKQGVPYSAGRLGVTTGMKVRRQRPHPEYLMHAAATFEDEGLSDPSLMELKYPTPGRLTAWELGIPSDIILFAHASLLIIDHPEITSSAIAKTELYNEMGQLTALTEVDGRHYLTIYKHRRGPDQAEQRILLTERCVEVVKNLISLTAPLRDHLRKSGNDEWRRLFLYVKSMGCQPKSWAPAGSAHYRAPILAQRIQITTGADEATASLAGRRFTLARLRASVGVLVLVRTGSAEEMAKALGHAEYRPELLSRYIPPPVQTYLSESLVLTFQTKLICHALEGSAHLLEASGFHSMDELDKFLSEHALRRIPAHLLPAEQRGESKSEDRVVFGIGIGVLQVLWSLVLAVSADEGNACGRAVRWAHIGRHLFSHLESQKEQPEYRRIAHRAKASANPDLIRGVLSV